MDKQDRRHMWLFIAFMLTLVGFPIILLLRWGR
jgi:hypothetical protein